MESDKLNHFWEHISCMCIHLHVQVVYLCICMSVLLVFAHCRLGEGGVYPIGVFSLLCLTFFILFKVEAINMLYIGSIFIYVLVVFMLIDRCLIVFTWFKTKTLRWSEKLSMTDKALLLEKQGWWLPEGANQSPELFISQVRGIERFS